MHADVQEQVKQHHATAMKFTDEALAARRRGDNLTAAQCFRSASEQERAVADLMLCEAERSDSSGSLTDESLTALRQEYQQLATKELARTLTPENAVRIEIIAKQLSDNEMQSETSRAWVEQAAEMSALLQDLRKILEALPDKR